MKIPQALSSDGKRIGKDCQVCHSILSGEAEGTFEHPVDIGDLREMNCPDWACSEAREAR